MKKIQLGLFCVYLVIQINICIAQNYDILSPSTEIIETVFDNRSIAMGKTAITTANSSSAIFSNPSILSSFVDGQFQIGGKLLYGTITDGRSSEFYDSYEASYTPFPNRSYIGFAIPYSYDNQSRIALGIAYQRNEGERIEEEVVNLIERWSDTRDTTVKTRITTTSTYRSRGQLSTIVPCIAFNYDNSFYFGISLNRTYGDILVNAERKSSEEQVELELEREQSAFYFKVGALADFTPKLSIGLTYRSEFEWELQDTISKLYENGELDSERDREIEELTIPGMWGIGVKYQASPELTIAAELKSRPYSDLQWHRDIEDQPIIDDGYCVSIGLEFLESGYPIRIGAYRDVIPFVDEDDTEPVELIGLTTGIGSRIGDDFSWDASLLWGRWERTVDDDGHEYTEDLVRFGVSVTVHFTTY